MTVRLRRLQSDYEAVRRLVHLHPRIAIEGVFGQPPERYRLLLRVSSLREHGDVVAPADEHRLEIVLPRGYPRDAPMFRMLTPVFHPNIAPHAVCIGDHWAAGEPLDLLIQRVAEMLAYQSYNVKSPLNGRAAQWVESNRDRLPLDREDLFVDLSKDTEPAPTSACANCGAAPTASAPCPAGHLACADCALACARCGRALCLTCGETRCAAC
jgi:hypothetical protein